MGAGTLMKLTKPVIKLTKNGMRFLTKNSNVLLTVVSATGVLATVAVAIKGTIKAVKLCEEKKITGGKEVLETVWKCYIPTIGMVILTTTAILCNGRINAKRIAVLTSAYSGSVEMIKKIEEKMSEQIGPKKTQKAVDEAEAAIAKANAPSNRNDIIATGKGTNLFYCATTGQWFYSDYHGIELAEMKVQKIVDDAVKTWGSVSDYVMVGDAQEALNLPITDMGENMGWSLDDFSERPTDNVKFIISCDWMDLPWGKENVGVVRMYPWPSNI